jgi:hypothetical protein
MSNKINVLAHPSTRLISVIYKSQGQCNTYKKKKAFENCKLEYIFSPLFCFGERTRILEYLTFPRLNCNRKFVSVLIIIIESAIRNISVLERALE